MALSLRLKSLPQISFKCHNLLSHFSSSYISYSDSEAPTQQLCFATATAMADVKPELPNLQPSNDADLISQILLQHHNPFHATESSLQLTGVVLTPSLFHQILLRLRHSSKVALAFFQYTSHHHPHNVCDTTAFNILIDILCKVRQFDVAWQFLIRMEQEKNGDFKKPNFTTFYILIRRLISAGFTRQAVRAFSEMHIFIGSSDTTVQGHNLEDSSEFHLCFLLDTLCKYGHVKLATELFNKEKSRLELNSKIYTILIYGWCKVKKIAMAKRFFNEMMDKGIEASIVTYNVMLNGICRRSSVHPEERFDRVIREAEKMFDEMREKGLEPDVISYSILLHVYSRAHKPGLSLEKLKMMKESGISPSIATYTSVIKCLCSCGRIVDAEKLLDEMVRDGVSPSAATLNCFFKEYRGRKDAKSAMNLYKKMKEEDGCFCKPDIHTYNILLGMFVRLGKGGLAREIWEDMKGVSGGPDLDSYTLLIHGFCEKCKWREACEYFMEMIEKGYLPQKVTFETLYKGLIQSDMLRTWRRLKKKIEEESITFGSEFENYHIKPYKR